MNTVKVKICGVRSLASAKAAIDAGADFLGFNFVKTSKRYIDPKKAKEIIDQIMDSNVSLVGVFQNEDSAVVNEISKELSLDYVQLHGDEDIAFINTMKASVIKVFALPVTFDKSEVIQKMTEQKSTYYMIDREKQGEGLLSDKALLHDLAREFPLFIAGGLTPENVTDIVQSVKPFAVDVASGIETDGEQDSEKIQLFIKNAKGATI